MIKFKTRTQAILLTAFLFTAMIPTAKANTIDALPTSSVTNSLANETNSVDNKSSSIIKAALTKEKAEELVRKNLNIPQDYSLEGAGLSTNRLVNGTRNIWSLDFAKRVNSKYVGSIYVTIDADNAQILYFNSYNNDANVKPSYPLKVERDAAQEIAASFIKEVAGDYAQQVKLNEYYGEQLLPALTGSVYHHFRFDRIVNNLTFLDNYIEVAVDSEGHIVEYSFIWDDTISFPAYENYLNIEQATAKIKELDIPELSYVLTNGGKEKGTPILSYSLKPLVLNATTGEKISDSYRNYRFNGEVSDKPVTEKPLAAKPSASKLSEAQALAKVEVAKLLPEGSELTDSSYNEQIDSETGHSFTSWYFTWSIKQAGKEIGSVWASVDGERGYLQNYYVSLYSGNNEAEKEKVSLDNAVSTATEFVKKQLPWLTHELYLVKPDPKQYEANTISNYYISFKHKIHGATADYDTISVSINANTGKVVGFDAYIQPYTYPSEAPTTITKGEAIEKLLDYYRTELTYRVVSEYSLDGKPLSIEKYNVLVAAGELNHNEELETKSKVELVYRLTEKQLHERVFLDAASGQWRTYENGEVTQLERPKLVDIEGHWAKPQLELMVAYKALDVVDGKVRPNEIIKRGELIKMLVIARNGGKYGFDTMNTTAAMKASFKDVAVSSEYFTYVEQALQQNLIDIGDGSFNPEAPVTREEMAELIVRALGYNTLAKYDNIFVDNFADSDKIKKKGQATIVVGLKIMSLTEDGKFLPQKQVQRAEAATAFFRYLQVRSELQEAPLRM